MHDGGIGRGGDAYLNTSLMNPDAKKCNDELEELVAYGKQQGWSP